LSRSIARQPDCDENARRMPTLPSGLEVAVDPAPLRKLLLDFDSPFNAHHVMALQGVDDLLRWLDVLILKPAEALTLDECVNSQSAPGGAPRGFRAVPTRVSQTGTYPRPNGTRTIESHSRSSSSGESDLRWLER
jgi:hypothetical protein